MESCVLRKSNPLLFYYRLQNNHKVNARFSAYLSSIFTFPNTLFYIEANVWIISHKEREIRRMKKNPVSSRNNHIAQCFRCFFFCSFSFILLPFYHLLIAFYFYLLFSALYVQCEKSIVKRERQRQTERRNIIALLTGPSKTTTKNI